PDFYLPPFLFHALRLPRSLPSFPTRRSSDLAFGLVVRPALDEHGLPRTRGLHGVQNRFPRGGFGARPRVTRQRIRAIDVVRRAGDRKSTRLNSSHEWISYAVFCLKKKNKLQQ